MQGTHAKCLRNTNLNSCPDKLQPDPNSSMLGAELAYDPKIKVVTLLEFYNFVLGCTSMQQLQSNMQLEIDALHNRYDLETKLALVMNTKIIPSDILNMFRVPLRSHKHFTLVTHNYFLGQPSMSSLRSLIR